ncbi:hypothetical protein HMPREF9074_08633 [Capnocytophaga sp. oral taxon 329 str. F0087]|nr:hypothetical protein HMPREF9074_08633 [Capnocytophaga sp. oral taxon 329 str. F0087]
MRQKLFFSSFRKLFMPQSYKTISNSANLRNSKLILSIKSLAISLITASY